MAQSLFDADAGFAQIASLERDLRHLQDQLDLKAPANPGNPNATRIGGKPPVPSGLTLTSRVDRIFISWNAVAIADLKYYEMQISADAAMANPETFRTSNPFFTYDKGTAGSQGYVRVRTVNISGRVSAYTGILNDLTGQVDSGGLADGAVTTIKLAVDAVTTAKIADDAITAALMAVDAVTSNAIASGAVTLGKIGLLAVPEGALATGAVTTGKLAANAVTAAKIAANTITAAEIAANTITATQILAGTITTTEIAAGTILAADIAAGTITAAKMSALTITASVIAADAIETAKINGLAVTTAKIANDATSIPNSTYTEASINIPTGGPGTETTIQSTTFTSTGGPVLVIASAVIATGTSARVVLKIKDGSTTILTTPATNSNTIEHVSMTIEDTPGSGSVTYNFTAQEISSGSTTCQAEARTVYCIEVLK